MVVAEHCLLALKFMRRMDQRTDMIDLLLIVHNAPDPLGLNDELPDVL